MKTIKIILGIITAIVVVFFATGLLIKETSYTTQVTVNKPVKEVFETFSNSENIKEWIPEIKSFEVINENIGKIGSSYKMVIENQGQEIAMTQKVIAYVKNEKLTLFFDAENMLKRDDYIFTEKEGNTIITLNTSCQSESFLMACMFPYFKGTFEKQDQSYLNNLKAFIEENKSSVDSFQ
ncbi:SRPBCC family protein [Polaribacter glomeratus]|uniref:1,4-dihydroxy-2-naphthoate prenyltransferase n=1 Tax=Polaribacter glomeratus TaxID=102 RepID=A0A2S7WWV5_9FLAO|nr:SRPBCC family protein [Polaribacter glomeratus]PQJ82037.1 1,4-dihydroxy-2-naphthoate prenyltransferase [Polaribacter glomeratus]TXD66630.1 SRPBCC family protein [Polaribacter glomeratus]